MYIESNLSKYVYVYGFKGDLKHVMYIYGLLNICDYGFMDISYVEVYIDSNLRTNIFVVMRLVCKLISIKWKHACMHDRGDLYTFKVCFHMLQLHFMCR